MMMPKVTSCAESNRLSFSKNFVLALAPTVHIGSNSNGYVRPITAIFRPVNESGHLFWVEERLLFHYQYSQLDRLVSLEL